MANKTRKEPRTVTTVNLDNRILAWLRSKPKNFQTQDWINDTLRKSIVVIEEAEKQSRMRDLEIEIQEKTAMLNGLKQEAAQKQRQAEIKIKAEAQYALEQKQITDLQETLDFFAKYSPEHKRFLAKLEYDNRAIIPSQRLPRLQALKNLLDEACQQGDGKVLVDQMRLATIG